MSKTIEEAANEYAANWEEKHNIHNPELYGLIVDAYKTSAERIMSLPLAQRLTAEEKDSIRETYKYHLNAIGDCYTHCMVRDELEHIFGVDFFKEVE